MRAARSVTHLEAFGRLARRHRALAGAARRTRPPEGRLRARYADLARRALAVAVDPVLPDFLNFTQRPPAAGGRRVPGPGPPARAARAARRPRRGDAANLVRALESTRVIMPALQQLAALHAPRWRRASRRSARRGIACASTTRCASTRSGTRATGSTATGPTFHWDYYNSFVIQPDAARRAGDACGDDSAGLGGDARAGGHGGPNATPRSRSGSSRPRGRSPRSAARSRIASAPSSCSRRWRSRRELPGRGVARAGARRADRRHPPLDRGAGHVRRRRAGCASASAGHQPGVGERYISTGSLYLCAVGPAARSGLPAADPFWTDPPQPWTSQRAWSGQPFPIDHALSD